MAYIATTDTSLCDMNEHVMGVCENGFRTVLDDHILDVAQDEGGVLSIATVRGRGRHLPETRGPTSIVR